MRHILAAVVVIFFGCGLLAQSTNSSEWQEDVKALLKKIRELRARVAVLEAKEQQREQASQTTQAQSQQPKPAEPLPLETQAVTPERQLGIFPGIRMAG